MVFFVYFPTASNYVVGKILQWNHAGYLSRRLYSQNLATLRTNHMSVASNVTSGWKGCKFKMLRKLKHKNKNLNGLLALDLGNSALVSDNSVLSGIQTYIYPTITMTKVDPDIIVCENILHTKWLPCLWN